VFTPKLGLSLKDAEFYCGFKDFDWQSWVTAMPAPSPFHPIGHGEISLTAPPSFLDPVPGGYTTCDDFGLCSDKPDNSYPYYYNPLNGELAKAQTSTTLKFTDVPGDTCLPGGSGLG
jgi:hypothetical protein